jgi:hypothetical protein
MRKEIPRAPFLTGSCAGVGKILREINRGSKLFGGERSEI